jgi:hypothetical protein
VLGHAGGEHRKDAGELDGGEKPDRPFARRVAEQAGSPNDDGTDEPDPEGDRRKTALGGDLQQDVAEHLDAAVKINYELADNAFSDGTVTLHTNPDPCVWTLPDVGAMAKQLPTTGRPCSARYTGSASSSASTIQTMRP